MDEDKIKQVIAAMDEFIEAEAEVELDTIEAWANKLREAVGEEPV